MASWYVEERAAKALLGRQRRRNAWLALGFALSLYLTAWSVRSFLG